MNKTDTIETECNAWIEEKEKTLIKLMHYAKPEDRIKYQVQIDFLNIVKINMPKILKQACTGTLQSRVQDKEVKQ